LSYFSGALIFRLALPLPSNIIALFGKEFNGLITRDARFLSKNILRNTNNFIHPDIHKEPTVQQ